MKTLDPLSRLLLQPKPVVKAVVEWLKEHQRAALNDLLSTKDFGEFHFYRGQVLKLTELVNMLSSVMEGSDE